METEIHSMNFKAEHLQLAKHLRIIGEDIDLIRGRGDSAPPGMLTRLRLAFARHKLSRGDTKDIGVGTDHIAVQQNESCAMVIGVVEMVPAMMVLYSDQENCKMNKIFTGIRVGHKRETGGHL